MKVPTYQKYGITKSQLEQFEEKNRKISNLLTHRIPIGLGLFLGAGFYALNYSKFSPSGFLQAAGQIFLFCTIGLVCIAFPLMFFKGVDNFYYKYLKHTNETYRQILKYKKDKEDYEYWHIRT